tara:strand:- start:3532 stop:4926 length:1395 start_codon:yes stop_codon:yes gene_type:complete
MGLLFKNLEKIGNKIALINEGKKKYTYKQIAFWAKRITSKIENGSLIIIISDNSLPSLVGYVSLMQSQHTIILLDQNFNFEFINQTIKKFKPNYIYARKLLFEKKNKVKALFNFREFCLFKTNYKNHKKLNKINKLILTTSGSTQSPKFVRLSNNNLVSNTKRIIRYLKINPRDTAITTMPMAYSYGLSIINTHLDCGSKIVISKKTIFEKDFWNIVKKNKVNSFGGVPQFFEHLSKLKFDKIKLPYLKYLTQAGGSLDTKYLEYFKKVCKKNKINFIVMYGQTEASPRMSYLPGRSFFKKTGSIGKALENCKFELIDKKNKKIFGSNKIGEIVFYGDNVCLGYGYSLKDLFLGDVNKKKLFTGDLAYRDKQGFYYIVGRKNRISKIFGIRIDLDEIEKKLERKGFKVKCLIDDKYLKILSNKKNKFKSENKIKKIIRNFSGIRENYIFFTNKKNNYYFKGFKN